ncbi:MAG TPA: tripartite tricarboxylate transporter substrate binding protein [Burkholderiales bacterium]
MLAPAIALAQGKQAKIVVGFPAGGPIDLVARLLGEQLGKELGTVVIVENRAGANAGIAAEYVARSAPDGQTLFLTSAGAMVISPSLYAKLPYDAMHDLTPVTLVANTAEVMVAGAADPAANTAEFIAHARKKSDGATLASSGVGSVPHLAMELLADVTKTKLRHVPYKGVAPAITDVIAGHVDALFIDVPVALGHIKAGKLKALGIAAPKRHPLLPDTRTLEEMGIKGVDSNNWYGIYGPKAMPAAELQRVNAALRRTLDDAGVKAKLAASGVEPAPTTPEGLAALQKADTEKWARIIKLKNIKGE